MAAYALPAAFTLLVWWASTGLILGLVRLPRSTFVATLIGATVVLGFGIHGLMVSSALTTPAAAYFAFASGLAVWAWIETSFLLGFITGPRRDACPAGCGGSGHFRHSVEAVIYHEVAILAAVVLVVMVTYGEPNQVGSWTFIALWLMRLSAKLNLFLGVANRGEQFLPPHLVYLKSFFGRRRQNALLPLSLIALAVVAACLIGEIVASDGSPFAITGYTLLATLVLLGLLEHGFMVLPLPSERLWQWRSETPPASKDPPHPLAVALPLGGLPCRIEPQNKPASSTTRRANAAGDKPT
jgi:putative photosynthetic complex assembly protein 2